MSDRPSEDRDLALELLQLLLTTLRVSARIFGTWALGYGALALWFGDDLWGMSPAYDTARVAPWSPESWGLALVLSGSLVFVGLATRWQWLVVGLAATALWCGTFAVLFLADAIGRGQPFGVTGFWVYAAMATLMTNGAFLRWKLAKY